MFGTTVEEGDRSEERGPYGMGATKKTKELRIARAQREYNTQRVVVVMSIFVAALILAARGY